MKAKLKFDSNASYVLMEEFLVEFPAFYVCAPFANNNSPVSIRYDPTEKQHFVKFTLTKPIALQDSQILMLQVFLSENLTASLMLFGPDGSLIAGKQC